MKYAGLIICCLTLICQVAETQIFKKLKQIERLETMGFAQGPVLSPDGRYLAFSKTSYNAIFVLNLETNEVKDVCSHLGSGWGMLWADNSRLIARSIQEGPTHRDRMMGMELINVEAKSESLLIPFSRKNRIEIPQRVSTGTVLLRNNKAVSTFDASSTSQGSKQSRLKEELWSFQGDKIVVETAATSTPGRRNIISMIVSPDAQKALVELLGQPSLYLFDKSAKSFRLAAEGGEHPCWINSDLYVYMETKDDGHKIVQGEIYAGSVTQRTRENLTASFTEIALNPTASPDGKIVFNSLDGQLYLMQIQPN